MNEFESQRRLISMYKVHVNVDDNPHSASYVMVPLNANQLVTILSAVDKTHKADLKQLELGRQCRVLLVDAVKYSMPDADKVLKMLEIT